MKSLTTTYRIRTSDVDIRKNYKAFAFMSMAQEMANWHASRIGFGYADLIKDNISWVVSRMRVKYLEAPKWEDGIQFTTWHKGPDGVFSLRDFEVADEEGKRTLIQATSSWLLIDTATRRMLRPDHVLGEKSPATALDRDAITEHCGKLVTPKEGMELMGLRHPAAGDRIRQGHRRIPDQFQPRDTSGRDRRTAARNCGARYILRGRPLCRQDGLPVLDTAQTLIFPY